MGLHTTDQTGFVNLMLYLTFIWEIKFYVGLVLSISHLNKISTVTYTIEVTIFHLLPPQYIKK